jgi:para-aminobenzoate synthetase component 1
VPKRNKSTFTVTDIHAFQNKMLYWLKQYNIFCFLHNNLPITNYNDYTYIVGIGSINTYSKLEQLDDNDDWLFGHLGYNLKNEIETLTSNKEDYIGFDNIGFFSPQHVIYLTENVLTIETFQSPENIWQQIQNTTVKEIDCTIDISTISCRVTKQIYLDDVNEIKAHIQRGDCYELNYCMEFYANKATIIPESVYSKLSQLSPNPFSAFYKNENQYLICASPERYLKKEGTKIISQPIKGTIKRSLKKTEDAILKKALQNSTKERSENIMIVDLVRNDLSRICEPGSVKVEDYLGVYSFPQVHHLISTVVGQLKMECTFSTIIKATFPMGSMTGAPKKRVMELIEQYEKSNRGIFSGSVGYITPTGDFDFNVVIRSIMYNAATKYLSYQVGSGITIYCDAEKEYEECLLKAKAIEKVLQ